MLRIQGDENNQENYDIKDNNDIILQDVNTNYSKRSQRNKKYYFQKKFLDTTFQSPIIQDRNIYLNYSISDEFYPPTDEKEIF